MARARANGIELEYETHGRPGDEPIVLVMGLGGQLLLWEEPFVEKLAARGHFVLRFDNRDIGLSSHFDSAGVPSPVELMTALAAGQPPNVPYTLDDMADDAVELASALGIESAHYVGASMGGMIVQTIGYRHPARVRSLVSIMSAPGMPVSKPGMVELLNAPPAVDRDAQVDAEVEMWRVLQSPGWPFDEGRVRARSERSHARSFHPEGQARQMAAIVAHGDRTGRLGGVRAPTLVIHGTDDPLVDVAGGKQTAAAIAGAELELIDGMSHDLPVELHDRLVESISAHVKKASAVRR